MLKTIRTGFNLMSMISKLFLNIASSDLLNTKARLLIYHQLGLKLNYNLYIGSRCYFSHSDLRNISLGRNVYINHDVFFDNGAEIRIGNNVDIAPHVKLITATHHVSSSNKRAGRGCIRKPIVIGNGCWIGADVIILPGAIIGDGCLIGAGAVINENAVLEPNGLYKGDRAKKIRDLPFEILPSQ